MDDPIAVKTRRLLHTVSITALTALLAVGGLVAWQYDDTLREQVHAGLRREASWRAREADRYLDDLKKALEQLSVAHSLEEFLDPQRGGELLRVLQRARPGVFMDLGVVSPEGKLAGYAGPFHPDEAPYAGQSWYERALAEHSRVSDVFTGPQGAPHMVATLRQQGGDANGDGAWVVRAGIDYPEFTRMVERPGRKYPGSAFVLNTEGRPQTTSWASTPGEADHFSRLLSNGGTRGGEPQVIEADMGAGPSLYVAEPINNGRWVLVTRLPKRIAYRHMEAVRSRVIIAMGVGGFILFLATALLSRRIQALGTPGESEQQVVSEQVIEAGKLAAVGELATGIAHEINNPVAVMMEEAGWVSDLLDEPWFKDKEPAAEVFESLEQIRTQGMRCRDITQKLLSFARKTDPTLKCVCLNDLMGQLVGLSERKARYGNLHIVTDLAPDLPCVMASPSEMQQVLLNIINNAVDAMEASKGGEIKVSTREEDGFVAVKIADSGQGIPQSDLERIFDPFYTTKPVGKGTGLGLSICYGIVDKLGGKISVKSEVGKGTAFTIRMPVEEGGGCRPEPDRATGGSS